MKKPVAPLMIEHRLIERIVTPLLKEIKAIQNMNKIDCDFISEIIDFFQVYVDKIHHGKEEVILFRDLKTKNISKGY